MLQEKKDIEAWLEVGKTLNSKFKGQEDIVRHRYEPALCMYQKTLCHPM